MGKYHHVVVHFPSMVVAENTYFPPMVVVFSTGYFNLSELPTTMGENTTSWWSNLGKYNVFPKIDVLELEYPSKTHYIDENIRNIN